MTWAILARRLRIIRAMLAFDERMMQQLRAFRAQFQRFPGNFLQIKSADSHWALSCVTGVAVNADEQRQRPQILAQELGIIGFSFRSRAQRQGVSGRGR